MLERIRQAAAREADGERALADVRALAGFHRIQSSPGYADATRWLCEAIRRIGLEPETLAMQADGRTRALGFPIPEGWSGEHAVARLHAPGHAPVTVADFARAPLSWVQRSSGARGRFPVVAIETLEDLAHTEVRGRVVLSGLPVHAVLEQAVLGAGAVGLVSDGRRLLPPVRTADIDRDSLAYTSFWWAGDQPRGWGVVISPARGEEWRRRLASGERLELEVDADFQRHAATFDCVSVTIPGSLPGEVLVTSHLCHPQPGANDNASGVAATLECLRVLHALTLDGTLTEPRRTLRFLWMPEFTGTYAWMAAHPRRVAATVAAINLDMVGACQADCGSTLLLEQAPHFLGSFADDLLERARNAAHQWSTAGPGENVVRVADVPYSGGSDHALWLEPSAGVPCPMLIQWPDRYYHSDLDTPDRCDPASLAFAVRAAVGYVGFVAAAGANEVRSLLEWVTLATRRRMRLALQGPAPGPTTRAALERGQRALASVQRLAHGLPPGHAIREAIAQALPLAIEQLEGLWESEAQTELARTPPVQEPAGGRVPMRRLPSLPSPMRHLMPGWREASAAVRSAWTAAEEALPGGSTSADLMWFACDGRRGIGDITRLLCREGHEVTLAQVQEWFTQAVALGLCAWVDEAPEDGA